MCTPTPAGRPDAAPTIDPDDMTSKYNTQLSPSDELKYMEWAAKNNRQNDSYDYDMRGAWAEGVKQGDNGHFPDTYKKPNHPTFSNESKYNGVDGYSGGSWKENGKSFTFEPGPTNMKVHGAQKLQDYFKRVEEPNGVTLTLPK